MQEIGFIHLRATVFAGGLADRKINNTFEYREEKQLVQDLLSARYAVQSIPAPTQKIIAELIRKELCNWWVKSPYNVIVDAICDEIMAQLRVELVKAGARIIKVNNQNVFASNVCTGTFYNIQKKMDARYPCLISYLMTIDKAKAMAEPKY